jgi:hypothetical protein
MPMFSLSFSLTLFLSLSKLDDLSRISSENRNLRDEIDILREKAGKADLMEDKLKNLSQRTDTATELKEKIRVPKKKKWVLSALLLFYSFHFF